MPPKPPVERVTFSPGEFAVLFGKLQTWGYRQIYAGRVKAITEYGRILIPAAEVAKILGTAARYEGMKKPVRTKADFKAMKPELTRAWAEFLRRKRTGNAGPSNSPRHVPQSAESRPRKRQEARRAVMRRLSRSR